jgi:hypothetical protein
MALRRWWKGESPVHFPVVPVGAGGIAPPPHNNGGVEETARPDQQLNNCLMQLPTPPETREQPFLSPSRRGEYARMQGAEGEMFLS